MKKIALLLTIVSISSLSIAQEYYRRGYVVTLENDTINGLINDKEWQYSPQLVEFKENENSAPKTYRPQEIKAFTTTSGVYYESHHFKFDGDFLNDAAKSNGINYGTTRTPLRWVEGDYFLEVLVMGKFSLFKFNDPADRIHFMILEQGKSELEELQYRLYSTKIEGMSTVSTNENYKQQLINLCSERCPDLKSKILKISYNDRHLIQTLETINKCFKSEKQIPSLKLIQSEIKKPKFGIVAYVYLGKTNTTLFSYEGFNKVYLAGGISLEVFSKKRPNRFSVYNELKFKTFNEKGLYTFSSNPATLKFQSLKLTSMFRVTPKKISTLYLNAGLNYGFRLNSSLTTSQISLPSNAEFELGPAIGFGIKILPLKASIELRAEFDFPVKSQTDFNTNQTIGIAINKQFF